MKKEIFINKLCERAKIKGIEEYEVFFLSNLSLGVKVYEEKIENLTNNQNQGVSFRCKVNGKMGYSYSESLNEEDIDFLIDEAVSNGNCIESDDEQFIYGEKHQYKSLNTYSKKLDNLETKDIEKFLITMEQYAKSLDLRIEKVSYCYFGLGSGEVIIKNSKGLNLSNQGNVAYTFISVIAKENDVIKTDSEFMVSRDFSEFDYKKIAEGAVKKVLAKLDIKKTNIVTEKVIIENLAFSSLLGAMSNIFSADAVQKGISLLKDKLNQKVASSKFTLVDDPHLENGFGSAAFDSEGIPTEYTEIIKEGVLNTYLYNLKTANKDKVKSTGHASKGGYKGTIGISTYNLYVKNGEKTFEELVKEIEEGILITDFAGLHSGLNSISGDFSLAGEGFLIKNGKIQNALNQITVAGNFFQLLKDIEEIGNDLRFSLSDIGSPSIIVKGLKIAID